ncbi:N-formylglutamate deformylase [Acuticoccus sp. M5D2P5]|uniref:N-formylglutamate deformylase n=1 Tax=Acuticoccus kalidii TaxID=2910977 RepID=UPI001F43D311|nr:N-formylglutamate deformylase [Acuticoccus kalidii]MCF3933612.1 N-formylglutamate deformylase [Acuticoccus kalidii]
MSQPFTLTPGNGPILISVPHASTYIPSNIARRLNETGQAMTDTDWHLDHLAARFAGKASVISAGFHRYVIDANRDPSGASLYPGEATTDLIPTTDFDGNPLWIHGEEPTDGDIGERRAAYHTPYHEAIAAELLRIKEDHGVAVLFDLHSIRSVIPRLFEGTLPVYNVGTNDGATCDKAFEDAAAEECRATAETVVNGRFRGGWTVRFHGRPAEGVHAIQLETAQVHYMLERSPWSLTDGAADYVATLTRLVDRFTTIANEMA